MSSKAHSNGEAPKASEHQASLLPHLESLDRMLKLPVVDATWQQTQSVYGRVKGKYIQSSKLVQKNGGLFFFLQAT